MTKPSATLYRTTNWPSYNGRAAEIGGRHQPVTLIRAGKRHLPAVQRLGADHKPADSYERGLTGEAGQGGYPIRNCPPKCTLYCDRQASHHWQMPARFTGGETGEMIWQRPFTA